MSNSITPDSLLSQMRAVIEQAQGQISKPETVTNNGNDFSNVLKSAIDSVNSQQQSANQLATAFQNGDPNVDMSEVMIALQKSSVSFQAMVEVRNKLVSAYQEIMNMQV